MGNGGPTPPSVLDRLPACNCTYKAVRPHQALGYKTPDQFYHHWLDTNATGKEVLPDIS